MPVTIAMRRSRKARIDVQNQDVIDIKIIELFDTIYIHGCY